MKFNKLRSWVNKKVPFFNQKRHLCDNLYDKSKKILVKG